MDRRRVGRTARRPRLGGLRTRVALVVVLLALVCAGALMRSMNAQLAGAYRQTGRQVTLAIARSFDAGFSADDLRRPGRLRENLKALQRLHPELLGASVGLERMDGRVDLAAFTGRAAADGAVAAETGPPTGAVRYVERTVDGTRALLLTYPVTEPVAGSRVLLTLHFDLHELDVALARRQTQFRIGLVCIASGVAALLPALATLAIFRPLDELRLAMRRVRGGDLDMRLGWRRADELGALAREFDRMAADLQATHQQLSALALEDSITGLPNNRGIQGHLSAALRHARRDAGHLTVALLDLDHFKSINDRWGHPVGDAALRLLADTIRGTVRPQDLCGRVGGDEFLVAFPAADAAAATEIIERVRAQLAVTGVAGVDVLITVSAGIAEFPADAADQAGLIERADKALYRAKGAGRNRSCVHAEQEPARPTVATALGR